MAVTLERADHRLAKSKTDTKMLISNEAERLVYEPGLAGQKSEVMMSPAPCFAWRGFSLARPPPAPSSSPLRQMTTSLLRTAAALFVVAECIFHSQPKRLKARNLGVDIIVDLAVCHQMSG